MRLVLRSAAAFGFLGTLAGSLRAQTYEVAITVDDVPWTAPAAASRDAVLDGTDRILAALAERGVTATGFVVCHGMGLHPEATARWLAAGMELANHSATHRDLNMTPLGGWLADVRTCHDDLTALVGRVRYFRYPMLHQGPDARRYDAAAAVLADLAERNAPVTIDNSEWVLSGPYARAAAADDKSEMARMGRLYLDHMVEAARHARAVARERFGREVRQVLLLHASRLNADWLGPLLDALGAEGARLVPLERALADPIYQRDDAYRGPQGLSWLYRVAPSAPELAAWDEAAEEGLRNRVGEGGR